MPESNSETLGQVVKKKRLQLGMSLRDLAGVVGVHHATIDRIETDQFKVVDPAIIAGLAKALHLDKLYLFSLNGAGVDDEDIRIIARAANRMNSEQRHQMMAVLRASFADAFQNTDSDDLDVSGEADQDGRV